MPIISKI